MTFHPTSPTSLQPQTGQYFAPSGLAGATAASRYVGATASGSPASGTFAVGDYVIDQTGAIWVCTVAGSPGTWAELGALNTSAASIVPVATTAAAGSATTAAAANHVHPVATWLPSDQGMLAWNYDGPAGINGGSNVLATAGTMYTMAIKVTQTISVTNIVMGLVTNGGTLTSAQCFAALYQGAGGAKVGVSADQAAAWGAGATKLLTMALTGGPFNVTAGIVYVGVWFNGTTGPAFLRQQGAFPGAFNAGLADAASRWGTANTGLTNLASAPGTLGTITATGAVAAYWCALS